MKLHVWDAVGSLYQLLRGNSDGSVHADITKVGGTALALGAAAKAASVPISLPTNQVRGGGSYETVAASATDQALGATGAAGDYLDTLIIVPGTTSPGAVSIKDGAGAAITVFTGGATSVADLAPITVHIHATSTGGAWKVTTGANVTAIAAGVFT